MGRKRPRCRHCGAKPAAARGLCVEHYVDPAVRALYEECDPDQAVAVRMTPRQEHDDPVADVPGSEGKVAALARRWRMGWRLWEPGDAGRDDEAELRRMTEHQREGRDE